MGDKGYSAMRPMQIRLTVIGTSDGEIVYGPMKMMMTMYTGWKTTVPGLAMYDAKGGPITYSVAEDDMPGYTASYARSGNTITVTNTRNAGGTPGQTPSEPGSPADETQTLHDARTPLAGGGSTSQVGDCVN